MLTGMKRKKNPASEPAPALRPTTKELEQELYRVRYRNRYSAVMKSTLYTLITVAAIAILVATLWLPVLQIYGSSMTPTLADGEIVFSVKTGKMERGDIIAFYYNNKILVKRVIALSGEWITVEEDGSVVVGNYRLDEPYLSEKALGECDLEFPYQVPDGKIFVMGDHRATSLDSRSSTIGCVSEEQVVGRLLFRVWPLKSFGGI